jgi:hypothetical protein
MIFSEDRDELEYQVTELIYKCFASRVDREPMYDMLRTLYYYGSLEVVDIPVSYNMIKEKVDTLHSFLFAGNTANFNVDIENSNDDTRLQFILMAERAAEAISDRWYDCKLDTIMDLAVKYGIVYASYFVKMLPRNKSLKPFLVPPWRLGVLDENKTDINAQEAIAHNYGCSVHQFARDIVNHPRRHEIAERVQPSGMMNHGSLYPKGLKRIIFAASETGQDDGYPGGQIARFPIMTAVDKPYSMEDEIDMYEVWAWDDVQDDYRIFTVASGSVIVWDRFAGDAVEDGVLKKRGVYVQGRHPFIHVRPSPMDDYFFGWPDIFNIVRIQEWHTERLADIRQLLKKALDSPKYAENPQGGMIDERMAARELNRQGGFFTLRGPGKLGEFKPELPKDVYTELLDIRSLVDDMWGLTNITKGKGDVGVRSRGQADILSVFGSARLKNKAIRIEEACTAAGDLIFRLLQRYDGRHYALEDGKTFVMSQIENEVQVRVDSHSASPIFVGDLEDKMFAMKDRGMIDAETTIDGLGIFFKDAMKRKARRLYKEQMAAQQQAQKDAEKEVIEQERAEQKAKMQTVK